MLPLLSITRPMETGTSSRLKAFDRLQNVVFEYLECALREVRHQMVALIGDGDVERNYHGFRRKKSGSVLSDDRCLRAHEDRQDQAA